MAFTCARPTAPQSMAACCCRLALLAPDMPLLPAKLPPPAAAAGSEAWLSRMVCR
jgi:hypothetical protein